MNTEQTPSPSAFAVQPQPPIPPAKRRYIPGLMSWVVGLVVLFMLIGVVLPGTSSTCIKSPQVKAMAQAKQIGLALKLYAGDHDGDYPREGSPGMLGAVPQNSNDAFAVLLPTYLTNEVIFGNKLSVYQTRQADNEIDSPYTGKPVKTLEPGENAYAYVAGLTDSSAPTLPLVADGTDGTGHYVTDPKKRGGVWKGTKAVVVRIDNSAALETLAGPENARYVVRRDEAGKDDGNLLDVTRLGPGVRLLDPAVNPRKAP